MPRGRSRLPGGRGPLPTYNETVLNIDERASRVRRADTGYLYSLGSLYTPLTSYQFPSDTLFLAPMPWTDRSVQLVKIRITSGDNVAATHILTAIFALYRAEKVTGDTRFHMLSGTRMRITSTTAEDTVEQDLDQQHVVDGATTQLYLGWIRGAPASGTDDAEMAAANYSFAGSSNKSILPFRIHELGSQTSLPQTVDLSDLSSATANQIAMPSVLYLSRLGAQYLEEP